MDSNAIIIDTETTGFDKPQIVELAWAKYPRTDSDLFVRRYSPSKPIDWGAMAVHHIIPSDLTDCMPCVQVYDDVPFATYWIGHGVDYDWQALGSPPHVRRVDTLAMSRSLWPEVDSHSLSAMTYFLSTDKAEARELLKGAHGARTDVLLCHAVLLACCSVARINPLDLNALYAFSEDARVPKVMTFGKHKGKPISAVDRGYMNWYARQPDPDPYVLEAFRRSGF